MSTDPLDYSPSILDLQKAADARSEDGPLDNPGTAYRVVKDQANEIERLRAALAEHAIAQQYVNPSGVDDRKKFMCIICGAGDALTPGEIGHADGCLLASESAPGECDVSD